LIQITDWFWCQQADIRRLADSLQTFGLRVDMVQEISDLTGELNEAEVRLEITEGKLKVALETVKKMSSDQVLKNMMTAINSERSKTQTVVEEKNKLEKELKGQLAAAKAENDRLNVTLRQTKDFHEVTVRQLHQVKADAAEWVIPR
jgi:chromosome segregation ATPase